MFLLTVSAIGPSSALLQGSDPSQTNRVASRRDVTSKHDLDARRVAEHARQGGKSRDTVGFVRSRLGSAWSSQRASRVGDFQPGRNIEIVSNAVKTMVMVCFEGGVGPKIIDF